MANLEMEEPGSEAGAEIRARLRELAAMKAKRQRELEAAERALTGQPNPDTATSLLDLLPCLQVGAELLREQSFRELLEALHFGERFNPQPKALSVRVVLHPDLLTPPERPQASPLCQCTKPCRVSHRGAPSPGPAETHRCHVRWSKNPYCRRVRMKDTNSRNLTRCP